MPDEPRIHPINIDHLPDDARELGRMVAGLRYDALLQFMNGLLNGINIDASKDFYAGKQQLAFIGDDMRKSLYPFIENLERAWKISKPYMAEELEAIPEVH